MAAALETKITPLADLVIAANVIAKLPFFADFDPEALLATFREKALPKGSTLDAPGLLQLFIAMGWDKKPKVPGAGKKKSAAALPPTEDGEPPAEGGAEGGEEGEAAAPTEGEEGEAAAPTEGEEGEAAAPAEGEEAAAVAPEEGGEEGAAAAPAEGEEGAAATSEGGEPAAEGGAAGEEGAGAAAPAEAAMVDGEAATGAAEGAGGDAAAVDAPADAPSDASAAAAPEGAAADAAVAAAAPVTITPVDNSNAAKVWNAAVGAPRDQRVDGAWLVSTLALLKTGFGEGALRFAAKAADHAGTGAVCEADLWRAISRCASAPLGAPQRALLRRAWRTAEKYVKPEEEAVEGGGEEEGGEGEAAPQRPKTPKKGDPEDVKVVLDSFITIITEDPILADVLVKEVAIPIEAPPEEAEAGEE